MVKKSLPMAGGCGCNDEEAAVCGCRDEAEARGLEMLKQLPKADKSAPQAAAPGLASADAEGC